MVSGKQEKINQLPTALQSILKNIPLMALAYSGGLDSRFLCHAALLCGCEVLCLHAGGPHVTQAETREALDWLKKHDIPYIKFITDPLLIPQVAVNTRQRCYFCKKNMFSNITLILKQRGEIERGLCDGGNADDLKVYRPGLAAVKEYNARSPLAEAGLDKQSIRYLARKTGLENPEQKARPCLLTRFAYGMKPDRTLLRAIEAAEADLSLLYKDADFRLRLTPEPVLQCVCDNREVNVEALKILAARGFNNCHLLVSKNISGFFDKTNS